MKDAYAEMACLKRDGKLLPPTLTAEDQTDKTPKGARFTDQLFLRGIGKILKRELRNVMRAQPSRLHRPGACRGGRPNPILERCSCL